MKLQNKSTRILVWTFALWNVLFTVFGTPAAQAVALLPSQNQQSPSMYYSVDQLLDQATRQQIAANNTPQQTATISSSGRALYVSKTGSNVANGGSQTNPYATISYAVSQLQAGDTLYISEGTYSEAADFKVSGTANAYINVIGVGNVVIDGSSQATYDPAFDTAGHDYIRFQNLTVNNSRAGVKISAGSDHIIVDGMKTDKSQFAVVMTDASFVTLQNIVAANSRNAFRGEGATHDVLMQNIEAYGSKDIYAGYDVNYLNGDGFIFELATYNITFRNIISHDNWDAGFDIKASNALAENVVSYGNKNNFKTWGNNVRIVNALSFNAKIERQPNGGANEGFGINVRQGTTTIINSTFVDNENTDIKVGTSSANLTLINSIIARNLSSGKLLEQFGTFNHSNTLWYGANAPAGAVSNANPGFVNWAQKDFRLASASAAVNKGVANANLPSYDLGGNARITGGTVDLGAYEFGGNTLPPVDPKTYVSGISENQTVSGTVVVQVPAALRPTVTSVSYKLNNAQSTNSSTSPFVWGGSSGFDTKTLANGTYKLDAAIQTTDRGLLNASWNFTVQNSIIVEPPVDPRLAFNETGGVLSMEGENFHSTTTINGQNWQLVDRADGSAGKMLLAGPEMGRLLTGATSGPRADYKIHVNAPGTYYVWVRGYAQDGGSDSLNIGLDGQVIAGGASVAGFTYDGVASSWTGKNMSNTRISFTVSAAGDHVLNLWMREDGLMVDKIVVTKDANFAGTGSGPAESARVTGTNPDPDPNPDPNPNPNPSPTKTSDNRFLGLTENTTVAGIVKVQLNNQFITNASAVFFYIDGTKSTKVYAAPAIWGGAAGFDTRSLSNGTHTLSGIIKTSTGELNFSYAFRVNNSLATGVVIDCTNPANASHIACK